MASTSAVQGVAGPSLEAFRVPGTPAGTAYYVPNFCTAEEGQSLLDHINAAPRVRWKELSHRRLQNWGGLPHPKGMVPEPLPQWLVDVGAKLEQWSVFAGAARTQPNHCLVNEYRPGQGIMPHEDGPLYFPTVATVSVGWHTVLELYPKRPLEEEQSREPQFRLLLEPNSLLVLRDDLYTSYMHGIAERTSDLLDATYVNVAPERRGTLLERSQTRVSLTFRVVERVLKVKILR